MSNLSAAERLDLARYDFLEFMAGFRFPDMPEGKFLQVAPHHIQIYEKLSRSHRAICLLPRDSGKSTETGILYPLWVLGRNRSKSFLLISHSQAYAETFLQEVQRIMELDQHYISIFGELKPKQKSKWTDNEVIVEGAARRKEASFAVMGWGAHIIGRHPDYIILDDVIDRQVAESEILMENLKEWYRKELVPCLTLRSRLIIVGTRWRWDDLYGEIMEDPQLGEGFEKLIVSAILPNGESYWPERWPLERLLERKKEVGLHAWMSQYMNDPALEEAQEFKHEWILKYKQPIDKSKMTIYQAVDPAISEKDSAAFFAHVTVGIQDNHVYLLNQLRSHINPAKQVSTIRNLAATWSPEQIFIEDVAYQNALIRALPDLPVKGIKQSRDKIMRIRGLSPFFESGRIHIDESHEDFEKELLQFPRSGTYDLLDAFEMIIREVFAPRIERTGYCVTS